MNTGRLLGEEKESIFESVAYLHKPEDTLNIGYKYDAGRSGGKELLLGRRSLLLDYGIFLSLLVDTLLALFTDGLKIRWRLAEYNIL